MGAIGSRYARFSSFLFPPSRVVGYLQSLLSGQPEHHLGHNPAGGLAIIALLVLGAAVAAAGYATYQEVDGEWLEDLHEGAANAMLLLVFVHLAGVVVSSVLHRENLVRAMFTGWKPGRPEAGISRNHGVLGVVLLVAVLGFWAYSQSAPGRAFLAGSAMRCRRACGRPALRRTGRSMASSPRRCWPIPTTRRWCSTSACPNAPGWRC